MAYSEAAEKGGGELEALAVPMAAIAGEDVVLLETRIAEFVRGLRDEFGNTTEGPAPIRPLELARIETGAELQAIDGFYRLEALRKLGYTQVLATVEQLSPEQLIDRRLARVHEHRHVEVGRVVRLAEQAWRLSEWSGRLSLLNATLLQVGSKTGKALKLDGTTTKEVREWLDQKVELWGVRPAALCKNLMLAEDLPADFIDHVASNPTKRGKSDNLSPSHLRAISKVFGSNQPDQQRTVFEAARAYRLSVDETSLLASILAEDGLTARQAVQMIRANEEAFTSLDSATAEPVGKMVLRSASGKAAEKNLEGSPIIGVTKFLSVDFSPVRKREQFIRITNLEDVNQYTKELVAKYGIKPNSLEINNSYSEINGSIKFYGPFLTEVLNNLLISYGAMPPPKLEQFGTHLDYAYEADPHEFERAMLKLKVELIRLRGNGILVFDDVGDQRVFVAPMLIRDNRK